MMEPEWKGLVAVVDDDSQLLGVVSSMLSGEGYEVLASSTAEECLRELGDVHPDLVLTDVRMPGISGMELLEKIHVIDANIPVIIMTGYAEIDLAVEAIHRGAFDFILKPFRAPYLLHAVAKGIKHKQLIQLERNYKVELEETVRRRTRELADAFSRLEIMSREVIERLSTAAEFRDKGTGNHIKRIGIFAGLIARAMGLPDTHVEKLVLCSPMHDIGKIGIADAILLKAGPLSKEEFATMKNHTVIGEALLSGSSHEVIRMGALVARSHHERWDGTGYPDGLAGARIPVEGRIVILADQYDALRSLRPYKPPLNHSDACRVILEGDGRTMPAHFDPEALKAFSGVADEIDRIFLTLRGEDLPPK